MAPKTPLLDPHTYFDAYRDPFIAGMAVWLAHVIGWMIAIFAILRLFISRIEGLPPGAGREVYREFVPMVFLFAILAVLALLVVAGIMHTLSRYAGGTGSFGDALAVAGWSYAPDLIELPITYLAAWWQMRDMRLDASEPQQFLPEVEAAIEPTGGLMILTSLGVVVWSVYILAKGTAATHELPVGKTIWPALLIGFGAFVFRASGV